MLNFIPNNIQLEMYNTFFCHDFHVISKITEYEYKYTGYEFKYIEYEYKLYHWRAKIFFTFKVFLSP